MGDKKPASQDKPAKKCSKAEKEIRISEVIELIARGYEHRDIVRYGEEKKWGKADNVDKYIRLATAYLKKEAHFKRTDEIAKIRKRLNHVYHKALETKDLSTARLVLRDMRDMFGLDKEPESGELTLKMGSGKPVPLRSIIVERPKREEEPTDSSIDGQGK